MKLGLRGKEELRALLNWLNRTFSFWRVWSKKKGFVFVKGNGLFFTGGTIVRKRTLNDYQPFCNKRLPSNRQGQQDENLGLAGGLAYMYMLYTFAWIHCTHAWYHKDMYAHSNASKLALFYQTQFLDCNLNSLNHRRWWSTSSYWRQGW